METMDVTSRISRRCCRRVRSAGICRSAERLRSHGTTGRAPGRRARRGWGSGELRPQCPRRPAVTGDAGPWLGSRIVRTRWAMSVRPATARSSATSSGSSKVPERTPTIVGRSVDRRVRTECVDVPALGAAGLVDDAPADASSRCPMERTDVESACMSLYAPRCTAICDRSWHLSCVSSARSTVREAHA